MSRILVRGRAPTGVSETPRLFLRPFRLEDFEALYRLNADPEVMRHIGNGVRDRQETREHLERLVGHWAEHGFGLWAMILRDSGRMAGRCGLQHYDGTAEIELSFALAPELWGTGLTVEAGQVALAHGFSVLKLARIIATVRKANSRSRRVLEKLGMQPIAPRERYGRQVDAFAIERGDERDALQRGEPITPVVVRPAKREDLDAIRALFAEYAAWVGVDLEFQGFQNEMQTLPGDYRPTRGRLYLATRDTQGVGCVALRPLDERTGEVKRLFVRESLRGQAIGRRLMGEVLTAARAIGYQRLRLDTLPTMDAAIGLYRSLGFSDIPPYRENPITGARFLECDLRH